MDERRLSYFLAVVDEGSVTRAAQRLRVAQPSLSQALRAFESEPVSYTHLTLPTTERV